MAGTQRVQSTSIMIQDGADDAGVASKPTSPVESRKQSVASKPDDFTIPVAYQSVSAEVQSVIDKLATYERQNSFPDRSWQRSLSATEDGLPEGVDLDVVNQLSFHREQKKAYLKRAEAGGSSLVKDEHMRQFAYGHEPLPRDMLTRPVGKPNIVLQAKQAIRKMTGYEEPPPPINLIDEATMADHLMSIDFLEKKYQTNRLTGLTQQQVDERIARDGLNVLTPPKQKPLWLQFLICLVGGFGSILWVAAVLCILAYQPLGDPPDVYNIILALVIILVILAQAIFFFMQERRSSNLLASFSNMIPSFAQVLRDRQWQSVDSTRVIVGDIIRFKEGDKIAADARVFEVHQAKVEKSGLTGENEPIPLSIASTDQNLYETRNLALFGTSMIEGSATGIIINTSDRTVMGKIARVASTTASVTTSLQKELNYFIGLVAVMAVMACAIVVVGYYVGVYPSHPKFLSVSAVITFCIAVVVSLLPEGTPVALALILTLIARRMYLAKILVKKLTVLETLGSATLIASDKTGTLTQNLMTVNHLWLPSDRHDIPVDLDNDSMAENKRENADTPEMQLSGCYRFANIGKSVANAGLVYMLQLMALCNKTVFESKDEKWGTRMKNENVQRKIVGNPTEGALLKAANEYVDVDDLRKKTPIVNEIAFSSRKKFHLTVHEICDSTMFQSSGSVIQSSDQINQPGFLILVKGAPEYILSMCTKSVIDNCEVALDNTIMNRIMKANELFASNGERVLAFAYRKLAASDYNKDVDSDQEEIITQKLCFLGLAGIIDPPRDGVAEAIHECHTAKIRVMMVTGDHPTTAVAIAKAVNIVTKERVKTIIDVLREVPNKTDAQKRQESENKVLSKVKSFFKHASERTFRDEAIVITGTDIGSLTDAQWDNILCHKEVVFARTTPQNKLQIVKESRLRGDMVAVTGDGVNDAPALKAADLGIAMGICGSDVSKEAANMVLLDDNFVTIVNGIKEGRLLFENLKKVICYLFPNGSFSEILPVLAAVFLGMPIPLSTFLMIVICIGSDMIGSLALVHEAPESDIMTRPPRNARTDRLVNLRTILFAYFFVGIMESSISFFMFFLTMWIEGGVPPGKIVLSFEKWGNETWIDGLTSLDQQELVCKGQTAFFVALVMCQLWNLLAVRTRYQSMFRHKFQFKLVYFMLGEVAVVIVVSYLPVFNTYVYTRPAAWYNWFIPLGMGCIIPICDEIRKYVVRKYPNGILKKLAW